MYDVLSVCYIKFFEFYLKKTLYLTYMSLILYVHHIVPELRLKLHVEIKFPSNLSMPCWH